MKFGDSGARVVAFQQALEAAGYPLPRWGADGQFGDETRKAAHAFAADHALARSGNNFGRVAALLLDGRIAPTPPPFVVDRRNTGAPTYGPRPWSTINGITLHQTATHFQRDAIERTGRLSIHYTTLRIPFEDCPEYCIATQAADLHMRVAQAQRVFNTTDVGIEIDGHFEGVKGDLRSYWRPKGSGRLPIELLEGQVRSTLELIAHIVETVAFHGGKIEFIHAHRQTADSKRSDPGEDVWKRIALPAMEAHGLSDGGEGFFVPQRKNAVQSGVWSSDGPGWPIPREWDPRRSKFGYYDRPLRPERHE